MTSIILIYIFVTYIKYPNHNEYNKISFETLSASFVLLGSALVDQIDELDEDNELDDKIKYLRMKVY